ncbi:hypothetical protein D3C78_382350 [compost metagenome]
MSEHKRRVELLDGLLNGTIASLDIPAMMIHGGIINDHLDDFEAFFKKPNVEFMGIQYQHQESWEVDRPFTIQFYMFALGRESLLLKNEQ